MGNTRKINAFTHLKRMSTEMINIGLSVIIKSEEMIICNKIYLFIQWYQWWKEMSYISMNNHNILYKYKVHYKPHFKWNFQKNITSIAFTSPTTWYVFMDCFHIRHSYKSKKNICVNILELFWKFRKLRKTENMKKMARDNKEERQREITSNLQILQVRQIWSYEKQPQ